MTASSSEPPHSDLILYQAEDGNTRIEVHLQDETVWLSQAQMCQLFDKDKRTISEHIKNIFREGERDILTHAGGISNEVALEKARLNKIF